MTLRKAQYKCCKDVPIGDTEAMIRAHDEHILVLTSLVHVSLKSDGTVVTMTVTSGSEDKGRLFTLNVKDAESAQLLLKDFSLLLGTYKPLLFSTSS